MSLILQGSTSGSVTLQEPAVAGTTVLTLPAVSGTVLTTTSPKAGNVIQVVSATTTTTVSVSNSTFVDTTLTATITPTSATSKILVLVSQNGMRKLAGQALDDIGIKLFRDSTLIAQPAVFTAFTGTSLAFYGLSCSLSYLDSPATTSATTYKTQIANPDGSGAVSTQANNENSTITLMEIAV
jgi:hypothetical protein